MWVIFSSIYFADKKNMPTFAHQLKGIGAQMAESVDALVSNTSRFTPVPVRPRLWVRRRGLVSSLFFLCGFVRVGCGVVQSVAVWVTCLHLLSGDCVAIIRIVENPGVNKFSPCLFFYSYPIGFRLPNDLVTSNLQRPFDYFTK